MEEDQWNQFTEEAENGLVFNLLQWTVNQFNKGFNGLYLGCVF